MKDSFGNDHSNVIGLSSDTEGHAVLNLNQNFVRLIGTFAHGNTTYSTTGSLWIYADGKLIYENTGMERTSTPAAIDLDVRGVTQLRVERKASGWGGEMYWFLDATVS